MKSKRNLNFVLSTTLIPAMLLSAISQGAIANTKNFPGDNYELKILTFEDDKDTNYWSSLIAEDQYSDNLLYGGTTKENEAYSWYDKGNTELKHVLPFNYGTYNYWGGGHAISNYASTDFETFSNYMFQLTVFQDKDYEEGVLSRTGGGNNGSDNFAVHFGYADESGFNGITNLPSLSFADGKARIIDHMYVNITTYPLYCFLEGNGFTEPLGENDWVKIIATGYNDNVKTGTSEFYLVNFPEDILVLDWTLWELSELGAVTKVEFNMMGSSDNGYGFSQPAYFAYDDVAVRFELPSVDNITVSESETPGIYNYRYLCENISGKAIIAFYSDEKLVGMDIKDVNDGENEVSGSITPTKTPDKYKIMLWDSLESMTPLCDAVNGDIN